MMALYDIKRPDGVMTQAAPVNGAWYCHYTIQPDGFHQSGNIGQCNPIPGNEGHVEFLDDDGEPVDMISDYLPCYIVRQD